MLLSGLVPETTPFTAAASIVADGAAGGIEDDDEDMGGYGGVVDDDDVGGIEYGFCIACIEVRRVYVCACVVRDGQIVKADDRRRNEKSFAAQSNQIV